MDTHTIDEAIEKYVNERMVTGKEIAYEHFLAYTYMKHQGKEIAEFMTKVKGLSRYYIDFLKVMQNPFKGPELAWFASMLSIAIYSGLLLASEEQWPLGISLLVGTVINALYLISYTAKKWCDMNVMIAIYGEIVQIAEQELETLA